MDLTISIVNWNTRDELLRCLASVFEQTGIEMEVFVVDNASEDASAHVVREQFPQVTVFANDKNIGFSKAHNQSLMASTGRYFLILNPDTLMPEPDTMSKLVQVANDNLHIGILGPRIENPSGSLQFSARRFPTLGAALFRRTPLGRLFPKNKFVREYIMADWMHDEMRDVDWVSGSALMIRRETADKIGPLDGGFFMYCEDVDWCYRAKEANWNVVYYPMARVIHKIGASSDQRPIPMIYQFHRSMFRFYLKHYAKGIKALAAPIVFAGLAARALFMIALTRIPISREAQVDGERLVR